MPDNRGLLLQSAVIPEGACAVTAPFPTESTSSALPLSHLQQEPPAQDLGVPQLLTAQLQQGFGVQSLHLLSVSPSPPARVCTQTGQGT